MVRIDEVVINNVSADEVLAADGSITYDIEVNWQVKASGGSFRGPFRVQVLCEDQEIKGEDVAVGSAVKLCGLALDAAKRYHARVTAVISEGSSVSSEKLPLLLEKIEGIKGVFDGQSLNLTWNQPSEKVSGAIVTIKGGNTLKRHIDRFQAILEIPLYEISRSGSEITEIEFMAFGSDEKSYGPPAGKLFCYFKQPYISEILQISEASDGAEKKLMIKAAPFFNYREEELKGKDFQLQMYLTDGHGCYVYSARRPAEKSEGEIEFIFDEGPAYAPDMLKYYQAGVRVCSESFCNEKEERGHQLPLGRIREESLKYGRGKLNLSWSYEGGRQPVCYRIKDGDTAVYDTKNQYSYEWKEGETGEICAVPVFPCGVGMGISVSKSRLPMGLYVKDQEPAPLLGIGLGSQTREKLQAYIETEIFLTPWEAGKKEAAGPFTLERTADAYKLTADQSTVITYGQFMDFLLKLEELGAKKDRLVWICDTVPRLLTLTLEGAAEYACGVDKSNCFCSLTAGMRLKVEWEAFGHQQQDKKEDYGFQGSNVSYYGVTAKYPAGQEYLLNFDAFLNQMSGITFEEADGVKVGGSPKGFRHSIGGVLDLFHDKFRFPYYCIVYPGYYQPSTVPTTGFEGEHMLLLGSDSLKTMKESLDILSGEYAVLDEVPAAAAYFHGRVSVQPQIQVRFRNEARYVPAGSTLGDLCEESCLPPSCLETLRFKRSAGGILLGGESIKEAERADYLPVYPAGEAESEKMRDIVLMRGDVIDYEDA